MFKRLLRRSLFALCILTGGASAAVLQVEPGTGRLMGATGVTVNGALYDVRFRDGSCVGLFSGCDANTNFVFTSESQAFAASVALLSEVFIDGPYGPLDSYPSIASGCGTIGVDPCWVLTPFAYLSVDRVTFVVTLHTNSDFTDRVFGSGQALSTSYDTTPDVPLFAVYAVWTTHAVSAIPEPGILPVLATGLLALAFSRRRALKS